MSAKQKKKAKRTNRKKRTSSKMPVKVVQAVPKKPKTPGMPQKKPAEVRIFERHEFKTKVQEPEVVIDKTQDDGVLQSVVKNTGTEVKRRDWRGIRLVASVILVVATLVLGFALGRMMGDWLWKHDNAVGAQSISQQVAEETEEKSESAKVLVVAVQTMKKIQEKKEQEAQAWVEQNKGKRLVALTFDDGPSRATTPRLLSILREKNVKATFFVVGSMLRNAPELVRQELADGHEVGSHTIGHVNLSTMGGEAIQAEMVQMNQLFTELTGEKLTILRPPYGAISKVTQENTGMPLVIWSVDTLDWKNRNAMAVRRAAVTATFDGAVILMHDIQATTIDAVAGIIDDLRARGYEFMTVSELAKARGIKMQAGNIYGSFR